MPPGGLGPARDVANTEDRRTLGTGADAPPEGEHTVAASTSGPAPAVTRAAAILELLAHQRRPVGLGELARTLDLPKSSAANVCLALEAAGLLWRTDAGFTLGRKTVELGGAYLSGMDQVQEFYELCSRSVRISAETARVAVLDGLDVLYLARFDGRQPLRLTANIGDRFPATCTATGKALLARLPVDALDDRLAGKLALPTLTDRSISDPAAFRLEMARVREQGHAVDDEETTPGVFCLAVTAAGRRTDATMLAVSVTVLAARLTDELRDELLAELVVLAATMGTSLLPEG